MAAIDLARARARAQAASGAEGDGSFGAGVRIPEEPQPVLDKVKMYDQYLRGKSEEEGMVGYGGLIPEKGAIPMLTGALASGTFPPSVPLAVTGGEALDRWLHDEQNTPDNVSHDMLMNSLLEYVPSTLVPAVTNALKKSKFAETLYLKAAGVPANVKEEIKKTIARVSKQFGSGGKSIQKVDEMTKAMTKEVDDVIKGLDSQGVKVSTSDIVDNAEGNLMNSMDNRALNAEDISQAQSGMADQRAQWGATPPTESPIVGPTGNKRMIPGQGPQPIGIEEANQFKRNTYNDVADAYQAARVEGRSTSDRVMAGRKAAIAKATKEAIEGADSSGIIKSKNKDISDLLTWRDQMMKRTAAQRMSPALPANVYTPLMIEYMIKGGPGVGTGIGALRYMFSKPSLLGKAGKTMSFLEDMSYIPGGNTMIAQLLRDWEKDKKQNKK